MVLAMLVAVSLCAEPGELTPPPPPPNLSQSPVEPPPGPKTKDGVRFNYEAKLGVPAGYEVHSSPRYKLITAGIVGFGVGYAASVLLGFAGAPWGFVPLVGAAVVSVGVYAQADPRSSINMLGGFIGGFGPILIYVGTLIMLSTVAQLAGIIMTIIGFAVPNRWLERAVKSPVTVAPLFGPGFNGLAMRAEF